MKNDMDLQRSIGVFLDATLTSIYENVLLEFLRTKIWAGLAQRYPPLL